MKYFKNRIYVTKIMHISMRHGASRKTFIPLKKNQALKCIEPLTLPSLSFQKKTLISLITLKKKIVSETIIKFVILIN